MRKPKNQPEQPNGGACGSPAETDLLPQVSGGLGMLNLSVEELDGESTPGQS